MPGNEQGRSSRQRAASLLIAMLSVMVLVSGCSFISERTGVGGAKKLSSSDALLAQAEFDQLNQKWPHEVVDGYMKSLTGFSDVAAHVYVKKGFDPRSSSQSYEVMRSYKIEEFTVHEDTARVMVSYEISAQVAKTKKVKLVTVRRDKQFTLAKADGVWKITSGLSGRFVMEGRPGSAFAKRVVYYYDAGEQLTKANIYQVIDPVSSQDVYYSTIRILFYEGGLIPDGSHSWVPLNSTLLGVGRHGDALLVNLMPDFDDRLEREPLRLALTQIVATSLQFSGVKGAKFLIKNEPYFRLKELGLDPEQIITPGDLEALSPSQARSPSSSLSPSSTSDATIQASSEPGKGAPVAGQ